MARQQMVFRKNLPEILVNLPVGIIVKSYLENHRDVSLKDLMEEKDMMKIFQQSKYKPAK